MFENLSERLQRVVKNLSGQGRITEDNVRATLQEVRTALLEADVALPVIHQFIEQVTQQSLGTEVLQSVSPGQMLVKIVHDELVKIMGSTQATLTLHTAPPAVILLAGLQGSGKTTSSAKLARFLKETAKKSVLLVSTDVYRPAAIEQLKILANETQTAFFPADTTQDPVDIAKAAFQHAKRHLHDVLIVDTAGRLHVDDAMMKEIAALHHALSPIETLFVVDSMTGQDAANTAHAFGAALPLTGVILTKLDGDARGGAALSVRHITGKPIKFVGIGEKLDALQPFYPDRIASRILGMGDILSLVEEVQQKVDQKKAEKLAKKFRKGQEFDFEDFREQLKQMRNMGGMKSLLDKLPGMGQLPAAARDKLDDKMFIQFEAMINSMTPKERFFPESIRGTRKQRIAKGSGTQIQDVNRLLKQFAQMQKMMKRFSNVGKLKNLMKNMGNIPGFMPPPGGFK